jgi:general secretion pathway protein G
MALAGVNDVRKDKNLHPLNTDFDLYSLGPDGESRLPLTAGPSRDDILRANNGAFIGRAENYN